MGIIVTGASIVVMCSAGIALSTVFKWLHTYEYDITGGKDDKVDHRERLNNLSSRPRNAK
ncbi:hypothetical protein MARVELLAND_136 [Bacillus phage vB_BspM_MarvelLand]|nr:hypothetical protein MARVELLAND_136 [Bacillus phage vB_BspM_MarvelLand]